MDPVNSTVSANNISSEEVGKILQRYYNPSIQNEFGYERILSDLRSLIVRKQSELLNWVETKIELKTPVSKLLVALAIFYPYETLEKTNGVLREILIQIKNFYFYMIKMLNYFYRLIRFRKIQNFEPATVRILQHVTISPNPLFRAIDWYLCSTKVKDDDKPDILQITENIESNKNLAEDSITLKIEKPDKSENEIIYKGQKITWKKEKFTETIYEFSKENKRDNFLIELCSQTMSKEGLQNFCKYVCTKYAEHLADVTWKQILYKNNDKRWVKDKMPPNKRELKTIVLKDGLEETIYNKFLEFVQSEEKFTKKGIPYTMKMLFYGKPGTGKTTMIKFISQVFQLHIYYLNLNEVNTDKDFISLINSVEFSDGLLVIEDIDQMGDIALDEQYQKNDNSIENKNDDTNFDDNGKKLCVSTIFNVLDGIKTPHGMKIILTANKPKKLNQTMFRDGRIDNKIRFHYASKVEVCKMFNNFYEDDISKKFTNNDFNFVNKIAPSTVEKYMRSNINDYLKAYNQLKDFCENKNENDFDSDSDDDEKNVDYDENDENKSVGYAID